MASRKLIVQVCNAKNLMPKDGQGTASSYVVVDYDGQRRRTKTKFRDLNPEWDEKLEFLVHDKDAMAMELSIYNDKTMMNGKRSAFLGKVKVAGSTFVPLGSETLVYYPLEKRSVFSQIRGEVGLKIWYVYEDAVAETPVVEKKEENMETVVEEEVKKDDEIEKPATSEERSPETVIPEETPAPPPPPATEALNPPIAQSIETTKDMKKEAEITEKRSESTVRELEVRSVSADRSRSTYDLVDPMPFFFVRVVKAKCTAPDSVYAKLVIGTHSVKTRSQKADKDWDQVFAFDNESLNSTSLQVSVWEIKDSTEASLGTVSFDLQDVPKRVPPDSPLAPQWYTLEAASCEEADVMLAVWIGNQADEAFQEAWQSDSGGLLPETRAKVYLSPKLWYLRLTVIQTQDLQVPEPKAQNLELHVKAQLGAQVFKTSQTSFGSASSNPTWNEDLVFIAAEPFEPYLTLTVEDANNEQSMGQVKVHVASMDRRIDDKTEPRSRWFNLIGSEESQPYKGRIHVRACLEGGYHVLDEAAHVTSDVNASAKQLAKPPIGLLEVGIRGATNLLPVKTSDGTRGTTDAYVVAKYGSKWVRTRTILDRFNPRWNEQYTWDVHDPCTVLTIGVFDNGRYKRTESSGKDRDVRIGKLRFRLSTLDTNRVYINTYSLTTLLPNGAKRMGEIELSVRFSCSSWISLIQAYANPMLPRMHYVKPLNPPQQEILRHTAIKVVTAKLGRSEPPLGAEVVQFLLDSDTHIWSLRRSKANWFRVVKCLSYVAVVDRWVDGIRQWTHTPTTVMAHLLLAAIVVCPHLLLPTVFMYAFLILVLRFRCRVRSLLNMDPRLSCVDAVGLEELDEEFDGLPSSRPVDVIRFRYDRLRALAGRAQTLMGDVAAQGERLEALMNWRDPRATAIFAIACFLASLFFYTVPFRGFFLGFGFYYLRHPRFRDDLPPIHVNFFRRLPSLSDQIL